MAEAPFPDIDHSNLDFHDPPRLMWISVQEAVKLLWSENPKLHSIGDLVQSIEKYGFQELPRFDANLPNVSGAKGAIKAGNGRIETLAIMEYDGMQLPRGLAQGKATGDWVMPLLVGTDADSLNAARAYAIDSNNLTLSGGDFTAYDMSRLWNSEDYVKMLKQLGDDGEFAVTVDPETLDSLFALNNLASEDIKEQVNFEASMQRIIITLPMDNLIPALELLKMFFSSHPELHAVINETSKRRIKNND